MSKSFERQITKSGEKRAQIEIDLFKRNSVNDLIKALEDYKSTLPVMMETFVKRLAQAGMRTAKTAISNASGDSDIGEFVITDAERSGKSIIMRLHFQGDDILFWEFGAGIYYNEGKAHPKAGEFGMGVGTYPGQTHAITPGYWWYKGEDGKLHFSLGTEAAMPMYNAYLEMVKQVDKIAEGSFW